MENVLHGGLQRLLHGRLAAVPRAWPEKVSLYNQDMNYRWKQVQGGLPPDQKLVALRMATPSGDRTHDISYGMGYYDARSQRWVYTAVPESEREALVIALCFLPEE
jgi:hypothetical protein